MRKAIGLVAVSAVYGSLALSTAALASGCTGDCAAADKTIPGKTTEAVVETKPVVQTETKTNTVTKVMTVTKVNNVYRTKYVDTITKRTTITTIQPIQRVTVVTQIEPITRVRIVEHATPPKVTTETGKHAKHAKAEPTKKTAHAKPTK